MSKWKKCIALSAISTENPKNVMHFQKKNIVLSIICKECGSNNDTVFKKAETIQILKINGLIHNVTG